MRVLAEVPVVRVSLSLSTDPQKRYRVEQFRGAVANAFSSDALFHQHDGEDGKLTYRYPLIHYRWQRDTGIIVGFREAAERLAQIPWMDLSLRLGESEVRSTEARIDLSRTEVGIADRLVRYRFQSPWLPLNQENYARYRGLSESERRDEMDRVLVGHILSALGGMGVRFPERLYAAFSLRGTRMCTYKGVKLLGARGQFVSNAILPQSIGLGKAVSHGFGWCEREV